MTSSYGDFLRHSLFNEPAKSTESGSRPWFDDMASRSRTLWDLPTRSSGGRGAGCLSDEEYGISRRTRQVFWSPEDVWKMQRAGALLRGLGCVSRLRLAMMVLVGAPRSVGDLKEMMGEGLPERWRDRLRELERWGLIKMGGRTLSDWVRATPQLAALAEAVGLVESGDGFLTGVGDEGSELVGLVEGGEDT